MAKIGCLKPFRGAYDDIKNIILEDGEIAFDTTYKRIYMGNGARTIGQINPYVDNYISYNRLCENPNFENHFPDNLTFTGYYSNFVRFGKLMFINIIFEVGSTNINAWEKLFSINSIKCQAEVMCTLFANQLYNGNILTTEIYAVDNGDGGTDFNSTSGLLANYKYNGFIAIPYVA